LRTFNSNEKAFCGVISRNGRRERQGSTLVYTSDTASLSIQYTAKRRARVDYQILIAHPLVTKAPEQEIAKRVVR
jgi:hypothetical protein